MISKDPLFSAVKDRLNDVLDPYKYTGRAASQVEEYVNTEVNPVLLRYKNYLGLKGEITV